MPSETRVQVWWPLPRAGLSYSRDKAEATTVSMSRAVGGPVFTGRLQFPGCFCGFVCVWLAPL